MYTCNICGKSINPETDGYRVLTEGEKETYLCTACAKALDIKEYQETGIIRTTLWTDAIVSLTKSPEAWKRTMVASMEEIQEAMKLNVEIEIWFGGKLPRYDKEEITCPEPMFGDAMVRYKNGILGREGSLQKYLRESEWRTHRAKVGKRLYSAQTMAGRALFQIEEPKTRHYVCCIFDESSANPRGGIQEIGATREEALSFLRQAELDWRAGKIKLKPVKK